MVRGIDVPVVMIRIVVMMLASAGNHMAVHDLMTVSSVDMQRQQSNQRNRKSGYGRERAQDWTGSHCLAVWRRPNAMSNCAGSAYP